MTSLNLTLTILAVAAGFGQFPDRHREEIEASRPNRQIQFNQISDYLKRLNDASTERREAFFHPDYTSPEAYAASVNELASHIKTRIGYPPPLAKEGQEARWEHVADDAYASIYRMWVEVLDGVEAYGMLSIPRNATDPAPLIICQHGGGGNPELIQGFSPDDGMGSGNYGWFVHRALERGYATWSPGLLFPFKGDEPIEGPARKKLDDDLRYAGTSILAIELWKISKGLDAVLKRPEIDPNRVGMMGLSYGGLYTLWAMALEPRIKVAVSSCYFNERVRYPWSDWMQFNSLNEFGDAEVCALICPRPFMVEVGISDTLFAVEGARAEAQRAKIHWEQMGVPDQFKYVEHDGGHEFRGEKAFDFVDAVLNR
ncbi:MAG: hypothetical protein AMXMBFR84_32820 [Candidatus Hydrogenedentota bacterium]